MRKLENLIDMVAEKLDNEEGEAWYGSLDMTYAYGQVPLDIQWCEERMRLGCSECKEFSNLIGSQSFAPQIPLV